MIDPTHERDESRDDTTYDSLLRWEWEGGAVPSTRLDDDRPVPPAAPSGRPVPLPERH